MNKIAALIFCFILIFFCAPACDNGDGSAPGKQEEQGRAAAGPGQEITVTALIKEAHAAYDKAIENGKTKEEAAKVAADFLESKDIVKEVKITSADSIRVIFTNKEEALLMLGRGRL